MGGLVWLASYPKSGNTWARAFLHNLLGGRSETQDINAMNGFTITDNTPAWYKPFVDRPVTEISPEALALLRPKVHEAISRSARGRILLKTHNALVVHAGVPMITMGLTAAAVYFLRNPLDVAISYSHHMGCSIDETIALMALKGRTTPSHPGGVYQLLGSWSENVESWTRKPNPALHLMRYEDMLDRPLETFGALTQFLQIAATTEDLGRAIELSSFDRLKAQEQTAGYREKPNTARVFFRTGRKDQWREALTSAQIAAIVDVHRQQMAHFGYLPEGY